MTATWVVIFIEAIHYNPNKILCSVERARDIIKTEHEETAEYLLTMKLVYSIFHAINK